MIWLIGFEVTVLEIVRVGISRKLQSQQKIPKLFIFKGSHLANGG